MIARCLCRRVGIAWSIGRMLGELLPLPYGAKDLVGRTVQEALTAVRSPEAPRLLEQIERADDVRANERIGIADAVVDMGLGRKMEDSIRSDLLQAIGDLLAYADIDLPESVATAMLLRCRPGSLAGCVGQSIEVVDLPVGMRLEQI